MADHPAESPGRPAAAGTRAMKLSIVTTLYRSQPYIQEFFARVSTAARALTPDFEVLFVNDGSPDDSLAAALALHARHSEVKVVDLSRNFGHYKAIMTGLSYAGGDYVFLIDVDLEEEPEVLLTFWKEMQADLELDVVYGVQKRRKGDIYERITGGLFYRLFNRFSDVRIPLDTVVTRLTTRRYNQALIQFREHQVNMDALWVMTGFKQKAVPVHKGSRGTTSYTFGRKLGLAVTALTSYSDLPLKFVFLLGSAVTAASFLAVVGLVFKRLVDKEALTGWTSLIVSIWFCSGLILFSLGVIGIYLSKIFAETKNRPYTIIRKFYAHAEAETRKQTD